MTTTTLRPSGDDFVESSVLGAEVDKTVTFERAQDWNCKFHAHNGHFRDEYGRTLLVRGVNVSGVSKLPTSPPGSTHLGEGFYDHRNVSFVGRPFAVEEIDEHFARLRAWGLTFVRLLITWESLEHSGPGLYDEEYIEYIIKTLEKAQEYGIKCFIDPHQDTWSRFSGGSGAPGWSFEVVGLDITKFMETGAAYVHQKAQDQGMHSAWPTNYQKLASATMFTVFFGGDIFAPKSTYQGQSVQEFLQSHFCAAFEHLARRVAHLDTVVGFELINEPHMGYIGLKSLHHWDPLKDLHLGEYPSAYQSMVLGAGIPQEIDVWVKSWPWPTRRDHTKLLNPNRVSAWLPERDCIWKHHGVWGLDATTGKPKALIPDYFTKNPATGQKINFYNDCYVPFLKRFTKSIKTVAPSALIFFEPIPNEDPPEFTPEDVDPNLVYAPHWYDLNALFTKSFGFVTHDVQGLSRGTKNVLTATYFGIRGANANYRGQVRNIVRTGQKKVGPTPLIIGECGIPMDINEKKAFETGDFRQHTDFLDAVINAMEASLANFTLWNYNPQNDNMWGDHWNGEDFSIYSPAGTPESSRTPSRSNSRSDLHEHHLSVPSLTKPSLALDLPKHHKRSPSMPATPFDITDAVIEETEGDRRHLHHVGGRALDAVIRPYASKIAGEPVLSRFSLETLEYTLAFSSVSSQGESIISASTSPDSTSKSLNPSWASPGHITEIFVPNFHYGMGELEVMVSDGEWKYDKARQTVYWLVDPEFVGEKSGERVVHRLRIGPPRKAVSGSVERYAAGSVGWVVQFWEVLQSLWKR